MALINQNSIIGITSITSPSASNVLTVHTNDTTERLRVSTSGLSFSGTNASLDTSGNLTVGGNVSIGGTLTYEDVTNIDSVGIVTARSGIHVTGGSVGIGTDNPSALLHLSSSVPIIKLQDNNNTGVSALQRIDAVPSTGGTQWFVGQNSTTTNDLYLYNVANANLLFGTNNTEKLRITSAGLVGIGTDSPGAILEVFDATSNTIVNVKSGDAGAVLNLIDNSARSSIEQNGTTLKISSDTGAEDASSDIRLQVDGSTKMLIDSSGNAILKSANAAFKSENPNSSGDYLRMYAGSGTSQWDIYTNGELLRMGDNSSSATAKVQFDNPTFHRSTATTTGVAALTAKQEVNNGGYLIFDGKNSSDTTVFSVTHNGRVKITDGIDFSSNANNAGMSSELLDDYEEGTFTAVLSSNTDPTLTSVSINNTTNSSNASYTKVGRLVTVTCRFAALHVDARNNVLYYITGLPFTSWVGNATTACIGEQRGLYFRYGGSSETTNNHHLYGYIGASTTTLSLGASKGSSPYSGWPATHNSGSSIYLNLTIQYLTET